MKKRFILTISFVFLLLGIIFFPLVGETINLKTNILNYSKSNFDVSSFENNIKPVGNLPSSEVLDDELSPEDEGDHFPCGWECWCYHASLKLENGQYWDAALIFVYFMNRTRKDGFTDGVSYWRFRHWDRQTGKFYDDFHRDPFPGVIQTEKNRVNVTYKYNYFRGLYPDYKVHLEDKTNNITTNIALHAISGVCWLGFESTDGVLVWGISGTGKVYFVPMLEVTGNISINGSFYNFTGFAYYEHDIGFFDFAKPYACYSLGELLDCIKTTRAEKKWYKDQVSNNRRDRLHQIHLSNDYIFGWNWGWVIFDNGWSIVIFRPTKFFKRDGLIPSQLYFTKNGEEYYQIGCTYWKNVNEKYIERADIYIPLDFETTAYKDDIEFDLVFNATTEITELYAKDFAPYSKHEGGTFFTCGVVNGHYKDNEDDVELKGTYSLDQTRWLSKYIKHKSLDIDLLLPPNGLGFTFKRVSHRLLGLESLLKIQLRPKLEFIFNIGSASKT